MLSIGISISIDQLEIIGGAASPDSLLMEDGSFLLLEDGSNILLE